MALCSDLNKSSNIIPITGQGQGLIWLGLLLRYFEQNFDDPWNHIGQRVEVKLGIYTVFGTCVPQPMLLFEKYRDS